jgi:fibronectin type 3 domain-containing protein
VSAENAVGEGPLSTEINATPVTVPTEPKNLAESSGDSYVNLTWLPPSSDGGTEITNYVIYKGTESGGEEYLKKSGNELFYNDTKVTNGITYYYYVCAENEVGIGELSDEIVAIPQTVPSAPRNLEESKGDSYIYLTWTEPLNDGGSPITNYLIYRSTEEGEKTLLAELDNVTEYNDTSVQNGVTYYYNVSAKNEVGEGMLSNELTIIPITIPSEPRFLLAVAMDDHINLSWNEPKEDGGSPISGYMIYRGETQGEEEFLKEVGNVLFYDDDTVSGGKTYYYVVIAKNDAGEGQQSESIMVKAKTTSEEELPMMWFIIIPVVIALILAVVLVTRSKKKKQAQEAETATFELLPETQEPMPTFTLEPEPEPVPMMALEQPAVTPGPALQFRPKVSPNATYRCPSCTRLFTTQNPQQPVVITCPSCLKQTIILPQ